MKNNNFHFESEIFIPDKDMFSQKVERSIFPDVIVTTVAAKFPTLFYQIVFINSSRNDRGR